MDWLTFGGLFLSEDSPDLDLDFCSVTMHCSLQFCEVYFKLHRLLILVMLYLITGIKTDHSLGKWEGSKLFPCNHRLFEILTIYEKIIQTQVVQMTRRDQVWTKSHQPTDRNAASLFFPKPTARWAWGSSQRQHELKEAGWLALGACAYSGMPAKSSGSPITSYVSTGTWGPCKAELGTELCGSVGCF